MSDDPTGVVDAAATSVSDDDLTAVATAAGWRVRATRDEDAEGLFALIGGVFSEYEGCVLDEDGLDADLWAWASHLEARGGTGWVVVDDADRVVACVGVTPTAEAPEVVGDVGAVELKRLYVDARARRRGLGAALVARVEQWARDHGAGAVMLWSDTRFTDAHRLYARLGYDRLDLRRQLHDPSDTTEAAFVRVLADAA